MVKKFLLSAAVVGALATSAMAYDLYPNNDLNNMNWSKQAGAVTLNKTAAKNNTGLIFPAYFVGNGWETTIKVVNTKNKPIVAKVVLYAADDSHEVKDFNIYLSANDVWVGKVKVDSDGVAKVISTDDSAPIPMKDGKYPMASTDNPMKEAIDVNSGYVEVIPMVEFSTDAHGSALRTAYVKFSKDARVNGSKKVIFKNGVITSPVASFPYIDINKSVSKNSYDVTGDNVGDGSFTKVQIGALDGYIRITDTVNGKDMIHKPVYASFNTTTGKNDAALVYLEGEKANLADVEINSSKQYDLSDLNKTISNFSVNNVYITYGEAPLNNMYALITSPFKRIEVQQTLKINNNAKSSKNFEGIKLKKDKSDIESYGYYTLVASIWDNNENLASAGQFSPYSTPTIKMTKEISTTGYDVNNDNSLVHYIAQAGYSEGVAVLERVSNKGINKTIPGIVTQMIATQAGGKVVTNWFDPITQ